MAESAYLGGSHIAWSQIRGMIRYETLMQWRSGSWKVLAAGYVVLVVIMLATFLQNPRYSYFSRDRLIDQQYFEYVLDETTGQWILHLRGVLRVDDWLQDRTVSDSDIARVQVTTMILQSLRISMVFMLAALPILMSEVIPLDRKLRVREMLNSYPLALPVYLIGKVLNVWLNSLKIGVVILLLLCGAGIILMGAFDLPVVLIDWLTNFAGVILFTGTVAVLIPAFAPSRRAALFVGILLVPFCLMVFAMSLQILYDLPGVVDPLYRFSMLSLNPYLPVGTILGNAAGLYLEGAGVAFVVLGGTWAIQRIQR